MRRDFDSSNNGAKEYNAFRSVKYIQDCSKVFDWETQVDGVQTSGQTSNSLHKEDR